MPDFFIVGAPKCGTTAMAQYLAAHPDVFMCPKKEMHVFGSDMHFGRSFYRRNLKAYLAEFRARSGQRRAGEASVLYLFSKRAAAEIKAFNPQARVIIMLREPAEMVHSLYYQLRFAGQEHLPTFAEAWAAQPERRTGRRIPRQCVSPKVLIYREIASYTEQVRRYFEVFGRERVQIIIYDDLAADAAAVYRATLAFLDVDPTSGKAGLKVVNGNKRPKNAALRAMLSEPLVRRTVLALARRLPRPVFTALGKAELRLWELNAHYERRPPLAAGLAAELKREFAPEVEQLSALLGRDLTHWSR